VPCIVTRRFARSETGFSKWRRFKLLLCSLSFFVFTQIEINLVGKCTRHNKRRRQRNKEAKER
jgi:hypothetical protein